MRNLDSIPANDGFLRQLPLDEIPFVLGEVERVRAILWARLAQGRSTASESRTSATTSAANPRATQVVQDRDPEKLLTVADAAALLGLSRSTVYQLMESGRLAYVRIGRARRIPRGSLLELTTRNRKGGWAE